jgi:ABC-2 type transport system ATP-binding protein
MQDGIVLVKDFRKSYGSMVAVDGISFEAQRGEIFGLLGPNGAGKTTTIECLEVTTSECGFKSVDVDPALTTAVAGPDRGAGSQRGYQAA